MVKLKIAKSPIRLYMKITRANAITCFWDTIYFIDYKSIKNNKVIKHEMQHIKQYRRDGILKFSIKYLYWAIKYGWWDNPYEKEAREVAGIKNKKDYLKLKKSLS